MGRKKYTPEERHAAFLSRVQKTESCWIWQGFVNPVTGYGQMWDGNRHTYAHRFAYTTWVGAIPAGLTIDHLCRVRACVFPNHLEAVSQQTNILRSPNGLAAINSQKTHCKHGHEFTILNTYLDRRRNRHCRECRRIADRARPSYGGAGQPTKR